MSGKVVGWAMEQRTGSPVTKLVLVKLADNANEMGFCFPSVELLVEHTELSERTVRQHLYRLAELNLVRIERRTENNVHLSNRYWLQVPWVLQQPQHHGKSGKTSKTNIAADAIPMQPAQDGVAAPAVGVLHGTAAHIEEPSIEPSIEPTEREIGAGARERATIGDLCTAFAAWPNVDPAFSRSEVGAAFAALGAEAPTLDELLACALARGKWLAEQNAKRKPSAGPYLVQAPHRWISERKWAGELKRLHDGAVTREAVAGARSGIQQRLGDDTVLKLLRGFTWAEIEGWFANCDFAAGPPPTFTFAKEFDRRWVSDRYAGRMQRIFGEGVVFSVKAKAAA